MSIYKEDIKDIAKGVENLAEIVGILQCIFGNGTDLLPQGPCHYKHTEESDEVKERRRKNLALSRGFIL